MQEVCKTFSADDAGLVQAQAFLEQYEENPRPAVIIDEIVSNIVRCSGATEFSIKLSISEGVDIMVFTDNGREFDPTSEIADPDVTASVQERKIGGLGIFLVKKMSKSVSYVRKEDHNVLTVEM